MIVLPEYTVRERIHEGEHNSIYRGERLDDKLALIFKLVNTPHPSQAQLARIKHEYELLKKLKGKGSVLAYDLVDYGNALILVLEDFGACSLDSLLEDENPSLRKNLQIAIGLTDSIEKIHQQAIIHKNINPGNILWDPDSMTTKLIDFSIAITLRKETAKADNPGQLEGLLPYISPEQTGRMNRDVDYRSDYYSLGVTLYQMFTGILPFQLTDPMELIHAHMAILPIAPHIIDRQIPEVVSAIIMKLLAKTAEDRYQSMYGLRWDLQCCLSQLEEYHAISTFAIGQKDVSSRFEIPEKLYGRDEVLQALTEQVNQVGSEKTVELILVSGEAGIGKTTLIHEVHKSIIEKQGYFISGKFDQIQKNVPFSALFSACEQLIKQLLSENETIIQEWKRSILNALGGKGKILTDHLPALIHLIGKQPEVMALDASETQQRFNAVFQNFIMALVSRKKPVILFLDDLQWADTSSLNLIKLLLTQTKNKSLLILGSYRNNETGPLHPLTLVLNAIKQSRGNLNHTVLSPLEEKDINQLLIDTLHQDNRNIKKLAQLCVEKTHGNPFFLNQFLKDLYNEGLIYFNTLKGSWGYDLEKIKDRESTGNVVEFMAHKLLKLPESTRNLLQNAACLGIQFDLQTLADTVNLPIKKVSSQLWEAMEEGLIIPMDSTYKYIADDINLNLNYRFFHDKVLQAAYSLFTEDEKKQAHLKIGRMLLKQTPPDQLEENLFKIVTQLNPGIDLMNSSNERLTLAHLNFAAGQRAKRAVANTIALNYFQTALQLVDDSLWETDAEFARMLNLETAETCYLCKDFKACELYCNIILAHPLELIQQLPVYKLKIFMYFAQGDISLAGRLIVNTLSQMEANFPKKVTRFDLLKMQLKIKHAIYSLDDKNLLNLPPMTDPYLLALSDFIGYSRQVILVYDIKLFYMHLLYLVLTSIRYGTNKNTPIAFSGYAMMLCAQGKIEEGYQMGEMVLERLKRESNVDNNDTLAEMIVWHYVKHWKEPIRNSISECFKIYINAVQVGNEEVATAAISSIPWRYYMSGYNLEKVREIIIQLRSEVNPVLQHNKTFFDFIGLVGQAVENLSTDVHNPMMLEGSYCKEDQFIPFLKSKSTYIGLFHVYFIKMQLAWLFYDYESAYNNLLQAKQYLMHVPPLPMTIIFKAYDSLIRLALWDKFSLVQKITHYRIIHKNQKYLARVIKHCPENYTDQYYLVKAEIARVLNQYKQAEDYYDKAIENAGKNLFLQNKAMATELAARFYLSQSREKTGRMYLIDAHYAYLAWGATSKANHLQNCYPQFLTKQDLTTWEQAQDPDYQNSGSLDLNTAIKASQAIAREIILDDLLNKSMQLIIENAGAEKGYILLEKKGKWLIAAASEADNTDLAKSLSSKNLPRTIIQYVIRSKDVVLLDDARKDELYSDDRYVKERQTKSVLCMPLLNKGKLSGILYLENNLTSGAFTKKHLTILRFLAAQIVISSDIARLYGEMAELNRVYSLFVPTEFLRFLGKKSILDIKLGDHVQQNMTVMFCDARNFTARSERMAPAENFDYINSLLKFVEPVINQHNGVIDKYIGDAILSLFIHADDALECALNILLAVQDYNKAYPNQAPTELGIGLNSGQVMLGILGAEHRMEGSVISDVVNVASRVEELTKTKNVPLLITSNTYKELRHLHRYHIQEVDSIVLRGKSSSITIYEVIPAEIKIF